jgi:lysocardiolipin and lysophospholipid acyltransferase
MDTATADAGLKQRHPPVSVQLEEKKPNERPKLSERAHSNHPAGRIKHGLFKQFLRMCAFAAYFNGSIIAYVQAAVTARQSTNTPPAYL